MFDVVAFPCSLTACKFEYIFSDELQCQVVVAGSAVGGAAGTLLLLMLPLLPLSLSPLQFIAMQLLR